MHKPKPVNMSKLRRSDDPRSLARRIGIVLNADGSVFDKKLSKQFHNLTAWYKEVL